MKLFGERVAHHEIIHHQHVLDEQRNVLGVYGDGRMLFVWVASVCAAVVALGGFLLGVGVSEHLGTRAIALGVPMVHQVVIKRSWDTDVKKPARSWLWT